MASSAVAAQEYWGYLIMPDKSPSPVLEQLLLGVANYIKWHVAPWDTNCLTGEKLANFYRLVGGDYDPLFVDTSEASLSFIYQSLGCFHTLQPESNPYNAPSIPALTPQGFVRWQTVQLLLEPEEHVPFLQNAVKRFEITNPVDGAPFPSLLPKEALPNEPDPDMLEWHQSVSEKLKLEAQASASRNLPPRPQMALSDNDVASSRDSSVDSHFVTSMTGYFAGPQAPHRAQTFPNSPPLNHPPPQYPHEGPWSPERRRSSVPDHSRGFPAPWSQEGLTSTTLQPPPKPPRPGHHVRSTSDVSTISTSTSDSSSITTSSASMSPVRYHTQLHPPISPGARRHSTHIPLQRPASHPQSYMLHQPQPERRKSVRWQDMDDVFDGPKFSPPNSRGHDYRSGQDYGDGRGTRDSMWDERASGRSVDQNTGVGGRRYPASGWR
ncbi:hypothetical protein P7C71_g4841, partial [Lecanoromycetidae sp. Uapishka_2]